EHGLSYQQAAAHVNLGMVQIGLSHFGDAIPEFQQARRIARTIGAAMLNAFAVGNIATCYYNLGDVTRALQAYLDLLPLQKKAGLSIPLRNSYLELGSIYLLQKQDEKAIEYFKQALALVRESDSPAAFASISAAIAQALAAVGSLQEAEHYNREGLSACNKD